MGVWFNSRPRTNLHEEKKYLRHVEIEALPTGGWGYRYFPYVARFARPLGLPRSATGRFHKSWGDNGGLKPAPALKYECCQMLSHGLTGGVGDLLHPSGRINEETYRLIGSVYAHIEACEPFVAGGQHLAEVAVVVDPALGDNPGPRVSGPSGPCSSSASSSTSCRPMLISAHTGWSSSREPRVDAPCARRCAASWRRGEA